MDVEDPHKAGLALLLAGKTTGLAEKGWSAEGALSPGEKPDANPEVDEDKARSRSPPTTRVAKAAAALEGRRS
jgi:hypothetical protein